MTAIPSSQRSLLLEEKFGSFALTANHPVPTPKRDEVLVKIHSTALNPADWKIQKHGLIVGEYPSVLGLDMAGEIVQLGEGVDEAGTFKVGNRVFFYGIVGQSDYCGFMEYTLADVFTLGKIPTNLSYDEAATLPATLTTAYMGLYSANPHGMGHEPPVREGLEGKYASSPLFVLGGASSVGQAAIQLGRLSGFSPIVTTASLKHTSFLKSLGATHIIDRNTPLTKSQIHNSITNNPILTVFDAISIPETMQQGLDVLSSGGQMAVVLGPEPSLVKQAKEEGKLIHTVYAMKTLPPHFELQREFWPKVELLLQSGKIKPNPLKVIPGGLGGIDTGLKMLEEGNVSGCKLVVHNQDLV